MHSSKIVRNVFFLALSGLLSGCLAEPISGDQHFDGETSSTEGDRSSSAERREQESGRWHLPATIPTDMPQTDTASASPDVCCSNGEGFCCEPPPPPPTETNIEDDWPIPEPDPKIDTSCEALTETAEDVCALRGLSSIEDCLDDGTTADCREVEYMVDGCNEEIDIAICARIIDIDSCNAVDEEDYLEFREDLCSERGMVYDPEFCWVQEPLPENLEDGESGALPPTLREACTIVPFELCTFPYRDAVACITDPENNR